MTGVPTVYCIVYALMKKMFYENKEYTTLH